MAGIMALTNNWAGAAEGAVVTRMGFFLGMMFVKRKKIVHAGHRS
jgi:hypothetical protein